MRKVLLVALNEAQVRYLAAFRSVFGETPSLRFVVTSKRRGAAARVVLEAARRRGLPFLPRSAAIRRFWDLVVFADHGDLFRFPRRLKRLRIQHCMATGKITGGEMYRYGPKYVLDRRGRPVYDRIFEASEWERDRAVREVPALEGSIAVVGDLDADDLLARRDDREECRRRMGLEPGERLALLWSTWGPEGLLARWGDRLLPEAGRLAAAGRWRFALSAHPGDWEAGGAAFRERMVDLRRRGIMVRQPGEEWITPFVAGDAMISDHTSLSGLFALLEKPLAYVGLPPGLLQPGSGLHELYELCPRVDDPGRLREVLEGAFPLEDMAGAASRLTSFPGRAAERIREEVGRLLGDADPPTRA